MLRFGLLAIAQIGKRQSISPPKDQTMPCEPSFNIFQLLAVIMQVSAFFATLIIARLTYTSARRAKKTDLALKYQDRWNSVDMLISRAIYRDHMKSDLPWKHLHAEDKKKHIIPLLNYLLELTRLMQRADLIDRSTIQVACPEVVLAARNLYNPGTMWLKEPENAHYKPIAILPVYFQKQSEIKQPLRAAIRSVIVSSIYNGHLVLKRGNKTTKNRRAAHIYSQEDMEINNFFDEDYYLSENPDVRDAGVDAYAHFMKFGWHERRNPSIKFDTIEYLRTYKDVFNAGINPLWHYAIHGRKQGFCPSEVMQLRRDQIQQN